MSKRLLSKCSILGLVLFIAVGADGSRGVEPSCFELGDPLIRCIDTGQESCTEVPGWWGDILCWDKAEEVYNEAPWEYEEEWEWYEQNCVAQAWCSEPDPEHEECADDEPYFECTWNH